jgi:hypothetical protein
LIHYLNPLLKDIWL